MAKDQIEEIKLKTDIVELINEFVPLKKAGRNFKANCPFHQEDTPSFVVSPERQIFKCFGCGEAGDAISFLMKMENMDFAEAIEILAKKVGITLESFKTGGKEQKKQVLYKINHLASEYYHYLLVNHSVGKKALNYLLQRGINKDLIAHFKIGYAPPFWDGAIAFLSKKKKYSLLDLEEAGLIIKGQSQNSFYDRFRDRIIFPLFDHRENVCGFSGRVLDNQKQAKYVNTPETLIYHKSNLLFGLNHAKSEIKEKQSAIVVEGEMDMISSWSVGVKNTVAIKGTALTDEQLKLLSRFTKKIKLALDQDVAGDLASRRAIESAEKLDMIVEVIKVKGGKDPDEVAQANPKAWRAQVKRATSIYDFLIDSSLSRFDRETPEGKRRISQEITPFLAVISSKVVQAYYAKKLADALDVSEESVIAEIENFLKDQKNRNAPYKAIENFKEKTRFSRREILEEYLLSLLFQSGKWKALRSRKVKPIVKLAKFARIIEILGKYLKKYKKLNSQRFSEMLPAELREAFDLLYLKELSGTIDNEQLLEKEIEKAIVELGKLDLKESLEQVAEKIEVLEKDQKKEHKEQLDSLYEEFRDLSKSLMALG